MPGNSSAFSSLGEGTQVPRVVGILCVDSGPPQPVTLIFSPCVCLRKILRALRGSRFRDLFQQAFEPPYLESVRREDSACVSHPVPHPCKGLCILLLLRSVARSVASLQTSFRELFSNEPLFWCTALTSCRFLWIPCCLFIGTIPGWSVPEWEVSEVSC